MRYKIIFHHFFRNSRVINPGFNRTKFKRLQTNFHVNMITHKELLEQYKTDLKDIFNAGIKAALPQAMIENKVKVQDNILFVDDKEFPLQENVYLVGFGKAAMGMTIALIPILGGRLKRGIVNVPEGSIDSIWKSNVKSNFPKLHNNVVEYHECAVNNSPDSRSLEATHDIIDLVEGLNENCTLIVLASGGGSSLLYMPRPMIDPEDKAYLCRALQNAGADIKELNIIRKKLSLVKGGGLARMAYPASVIAFILSDIVGDPKHQIASGPTVYSPKMSDEVISILQKYNLFQGLEGDIKNTIMLKEVYDDKHLLNAAKEFKHVHNVIIGNITAAIDAAKEEVMRKQLIPIFLCSDITANVQHVSLMYVQVTALICLLLEKCITVEEFFEKMQGIQMFGLSKKQVVDIYNVIKEVNNTGIVIIGGGEPTVVVKGTGRGGRNQELAMYFSLDWLAEVKINPLLARYDVLMLSAGTDGQDGPTDATGAFGDPSIGPIMYNMFKQVKSMILQKTAALEHEIKVKENDSLSTASPLVESCKTQILSGYIKSPPSQLHTSDYQTKEEPTEIIKYKQEELCSLTLMAMEIERMLPENTLKDNDSYNFLSRFKKGANLLKTGNTGTNVMDLHLIYVKKYNCECDIDMFGNDQTSTDIFAEHDLHVDPSTLEKYNASQI